MPVSECADPPRARGEGVELFQARTPKRVSSRPPSLCANDGRTMLLALACNT